MATELQESNSWDVEYPSIGLTLKCQLNTDEDKIRDNVKHALSLNLPEVWPCENYQMVDGERIENEQDILICCGGPSLLDSFDEIKQRQENGAKVVALANTAHILMFHGITPDAHVLLDAKPRNATFIQEELDCWHFISSQCDKSVFEAAKDKRVMLYHALNSEKDAELFEGRKWVPVQGGSTITMRTIRLFTLLGYKNFHTFGFDSCMKDGQHHAYEQPDADKQKSMNFEFEGTTYHVTSWMLAQFMEFQTFVKLFGMSINLQVHGDGLIADFIKKAYGHHQVKLEKV